MFHSTEEMFTAFDQNREDIVNQTVMKYDVSRKYVQEYINHLYKCHRHNDRAFAYFEAEMGLYKKTLNHLENLEAATSLKIEGLDVLDVGFGNANSLRAFIELGARIVVGLDADHGRCKAGKNMLKDYNLKASVVQGSILDSYIALKVGTKFDLITCFDVLEHVPSVKQTVAAFTLLLRPKGYVIATMPNRYYPDNMLHEPHYHLPAMTILSRLTAETYHHAMLPGDYEVYEWLTRNELVEIFQKYHFKIKHEIIPSRPEIIGVVTEAINSLRITSYPNEKIRGEVLKTLDHVESLTKLVENPDDFFGSSTFTIFGFLMPG